MLCRAIPGAISFYCYSIKDGGHNTSRVITAVFLHNKPKYTVSHEQVF